MFIVLNHKPVVSNAFDYTFLSLQIKDWRNSGDENARIVEAHLFEGMEPPRGLSHDFKDFMDLVSQMQISKFFSNINISSSPKLLQSNYNFTVKIGQFYTSFHS